MSLYSTFVNKVVTLVYQDVDRDWVKHELGRAIFFNTSIDGTSLRRATANVKEYWFYDFAPQSGDVVVDAGAGIGDETLVMSREVGPAGTVVAIEAHPQTYRCLQKTLRANRLTNVIALNIALSDQESVLRISDGENHLGNHVGSGPGIPIDALPLDTILNRHNLTPNLVKMNIEGAETLALAGATHTLQTTRHWVISCHDFKAESNNDPMLTHSRIIETFHQSGLSTQPPRVHVLPEIPYFVYASRIA